MGNDLSSSNDLMKKLQQTVLKDGWLESMYGAKKADQQSELKKIFTVVSENNITTSQRNAIESERDVLQEKVERLEAKMAVLEEEMAAKQEEIENQANEITNLITQVEDKSEELAQKQKKDVKIAIEDVFYLYEKGDIGKDAITGEIKKRITSSLAKTKGQAAIEKLLGKLDGKQSEVQALVDDATRWIDQKNLLQNQYGVTKSTYDLLNANLAQIGATETNYTNSDYDSKIPVYSLEKTEYVSTLFENTDLNVQAGNNSAYKEGSEAPNTDSIKEKYSKYMNTTATKGVDSYSINNEAVKNLGTAIEKGMLNDLMSAGLSYKEITDFLTDNFQNAQIKYNEEGKLQIPWGHGQEARDIYKSVTDFLDNYNTSLLGTLNTWDKEGGNTIDTNNQIKALQEGNICDILDKMGNSDPKFTFKEAMYALFDKDKGLFKDSGIVYDTSEQGETPNYFIEFAGDQKTADLYEQISDKIYDIWGVRHSRGADYETADLNDTTNNNKDDLKQDDDEIKRNDPITFKVDSREYAFVIDRNNDGAFSGTSDFVGGDSSTNWLNDLKSLDTDGDNKLSGDELKNLKLLGSDYTDNKSIKTDKNAYNPNKTESNKDYMRAETTNIQYTLTNADTLGIEEIDLTGLEGNVNQSTGKFDINDSEIFNDSFSFTLNGENITASRKDDTESFMKTVYGAAEGKNFNISMSESDIENVMNKDYGEYDQFASAYDDIYQNVNILQNAGKLAQEARARYEETLDRIQQDENVQLVKAGNKAASYSTESQWSSLESSVAQIAAEEGIEIDMQQAKGIHVLDGSLNAQGIVDTYKAQMAMEDAVSSSEANSKEAWAAIILCAKNNVECSADKVMELLNNGEAKSAEEVLEILKAAQGDGSVDVTVNDLGAISERENEIYEAFHNAFEEAGIHDKTVDALADLCISQQNDRSFMEGKSAEELAQQFVEKYKNN